MRIGFALAGRLLDMQPECMKVRVARGLQAATAEIESADGGQRVRFVQLRLALPGDPQCFFEKLLRRTEAPSHDLEASEPDEAGRLAVGIAEVLVYLACRNVLIVGAVVPPAPTRQLCEAEKRIRFTQAVIFASVESSRLSECSVRLVVAA